MKPSSVFGSYAYEGKVLDLVAYDYQGLCEVFEKIEEYRKTHYCLGFVAYEAYQALSSSSFNSKTPLAYFGIFSTQKTFHPPKSDDVFVPLFPKWIQREEYLDKVRALKEQIREGNTYQGNLTTMFSCTSSLNSYEIFLSILGRQDTPYRCFLPTPFGDVISFSPELFFCIDGEKITTKPMKGTMPRGKDEAEDRKNQEFLKNDIKNRSENVMIVDLLRNDLSRVAFDVSVPKLFEIETYPTLFQMTSTITAHLKEVGLFEIFKALFPCGSISGAPKKSTLEILKNLESGNRGVYCGALGVVEKNRAIFSIPIRTLYKEEENLFYGVGSGIVWDSQEESEYEELKTKMKFLYPDFSLFETMLYEDKKILFLSNHLERLRESSESLGFVYPKNLEKELKELELEGRHIVRVQLEIDGKYKFCFSPFIVHSNNTITLRERKGKSDLYAHKTSYRPWAKDIDYQSVFDVIFYDCEGRLLEGSRSNLVIQIGQKLYTPKFRGDFLRGIYRENMLKKKEIEERDLYLHDLRHASKIYCINSVRGMVEVNLN